MGGARTSRSALERRSLDGHCLLWLRQSRRIVDATLGQFASPVKSPGGFVIGRMVGATPPTRAAAVDGLECVEGDQVLCRALADARSTNFVGSASSDKWHELKSKFGSRL